MCNRYFNLSLLCLYRVPQKKTSICENVAWQRLLLIMKNPPSFFLTNAGDTFCDSYVYHMVGLHIGQLRSDINTLSSLKNDKTI